MMFRVFRAVVPATPDRCVRKVLRDKNFPKLLIPLDCLPLDLQFLRADIVHFLPALQHYAHHAPLPLDWRGVDVELRVFDAERGVQSDLLFTTCDLLSSGLVVVYHQVRSPLASSPAPQSESRQAPCSGSREMTPPNCQTFSTSVLSSGQAAQTRSSLSALRTGGHARCLVQAHLEYVWHMFDNSIDRALC